jgi:hypothetical protein
MMLVNYIAICINYAAVRSGISSVSDSHCDKRIVNAQDSLPSPVLILYLDLELVSGHDVGVPFLWHSHPHSTLTQTIVPSALGS